MKKSPLLLLMALVAVAAWAVPAKRVDITHRQKDGTELALTLVGDEYFHCYVNTATGEKMEMGSDGDFHTIDATTLDSRTASSVARRQTANQERVNRLPRMRQQASTDGARKSVGTFSNMTGQKRGLVILVNFKDVTFKSANNQAAFNNQFNKEGYSANSHIGSVRDYFIAQSYGNFSLDFDVVGPVTVSQNMAYYGANDSSGNDVRPAEMVIEALKLADKAGVDFSKYDWGGDGYVDQVFIVYAGYAEAQGASANTIWPHEWTLSSASYYGDGNGKQRIDGKYIDTYACTAELCGSSGSTMDGIGTACHEFSHCLGYPDLYDTNGTTDGSCWGMDAFDLMDYGSYSGPNGHGEVPCGYSAYQRWMAGWLTPVELTPGTGFTAKDIPALNDEPVAYIVYNDKVSSEYLLIENRQNKGFFKYLRQISTGHGLLITHIDYNATSWTNNKVNIDSSHERFKYIAADKSYSANNFPGDYFGPSVKALTSTSHSSYGGKWFNNTKAGNTKFADMDITNITERNGKISFDFNGGGPVDDGSRYTLTFLQNGVKVAELKQTEFRQTLTIPSIDSPFSGWDFVGWATETVENTTSKPALTLAGTTLVPEADVTYHAVFSSKASQDDGNLYRLVDSPESGSEYVIATSNAAGQAYALDASTLSTTGAASVAGASVTIADRSGLAIDNPAENIVWTLTYDSTNSYLYAQNGDNYLVVNGNGLSCKTSTAKIYWSDPYGLYGKSSSGTTSYYIYGDGAYLKTRQTGAINKRIYLYKGGGAVTYYSTSPTAQDYTVTFDACAGTCDTASFTQNHAEDKLSVALPEATIDVEGWTFAGWAGSAVAETTEEPAMLKAGAVYTPMADVTLYAVYTAVSYNGAVKIVHYNSNPAAAPANTFYSVSLSNGTELLADSWTQSLGNFTFTLPVPAQTYDGWTFYGWASEAVDQTLEAPSVREAGSEYTPEADTTFFAVFVNAKPAYISNPAVYIPGGGTQDPQFYFPHIARLGRPFVGPRFNTDSEGALTFSSSDPEVAAVDAATGKITVKAEGTAIITVSQEATPTHQAASASYMIKVVK